MIASAWHGIHVTLLMLAQSTDKGACLSSINSRLESARQQALSAKLVCITLGSAWAYELKETGQVVANCHKMPQVSFHRQCMPSTHPVFVFWCSHRSHRSPD